jgi:DNA-binding NarL/FixJ family response regulator
MKIELSEQQKLIVIFIANGLRFKEIAKRLAISFKTVDSQRQYIKMKLEEELERVTSVTLTLYAVRRGWVPPWFQPFR